MTTLVTAKDVKDWHWGGHVPADELLEQFAIVVNEGRRHMERRYSAEELALDAALQKVREGLKALPEVIGISHRLGYSTLASKLERLTAELGACIGKPVRGAPQVEWAMHAGLLLGLIEEAGSAVGRRISPIPILCDALNKITGELHSEDNVRKTLRRGQIGTLRFEIKSKT
jgi:hypothetical protein